MSLSSNISSFPSRWSAFALLALAAGLTGCTANFGDIASSGPAPVTAGGAVIKGTVHGGNNPVVGATIQLYGVGTTGYGSAATPLLSSTVTTDSNGGFSLGTTGNFKYSCPSSNLVYLTSAGGNPGLGGGTGNNNAGLTLMVALGSCSALQANAATTFINVNEETTVAAIWAMQQFASSTGSALSANLTTASDNIGTSSTNIQGLANAMNLANVLVNSATGLSPGANTSGNQTNVESWQINTIADILAACVNTNGAVTGPSSPTNCYTLFTNTGNATDTFQAALYMAKNPNANISTLTGLVGGTGAPFQPTNTSTNDFTIGLSFGTGTKTTRWIAIDQFGNAWVATNSTIGYELDPTGNIIASPSTYNLYNTAGTSTTAATVHGAYDVAIDTANNAWFTDNGNTAIFEVPGSLSAGVAGMGTNYGYPTSAASPEGIAVDGSGNVFATISSSKVQEIASGATTVTAGGTVGSSPFELAIDMSNQAGNPNHTLSNSGSFIYTMNEAGCAAADAVGSSSTLVSVGSIGMLYSTTDGLVPLSAFGDAGCSGATTQVPTETLSGNSYYMTSSPYGVRFDNNNAMWIVNQNYTTTYASTNNTQSGKYSLTKVAAQNYSTECTTTPCTSFSTTASASAVTPTTAAPGYTFTPVPLPANVTTTPVLGTAYPVFGGLNTPYYIAIDGAGAAWVSDGANYGSSSVCPTAGGVSAFTNAGVAISGQYGFCGGTYISATPTTYQRSLNVPKGIAVDISGNVWLTNANLDYVTVVVGQATPVVNPLSLGIKNGTLGAKP